MEEQDGEGEEKENKEGEQAGEEEDGEVEGRPDRQMGGWEISQQNSHIIDSESSENIC